MNKNKEEEKEEEATAGAAANGRKIVTLPRLGLQITKRKRRGKSPGFRNAGKGGHYVNDL